MPNPGPNFVATPYAQRGAQLEGLFLPESYGAAGDGTTDDTDALQQAIDDACEARGRVLLDSKTYAFEHLTITGSCSIAGNGVFGVYDTFASGVGNFTPSVTPWLRGSVLKCTATGQTEAVLMNGESQNVDLRDLGLVFANLWASTGHGFRANPGTGKNGLASPRWDNVQVFGHDGNSYGFFMTNAAQGTFTHLRAWGGGWVKFDDQGGSDYGNSTFLNGNGKLFVGGTAHYCHLNSVATRIGMIGCEFNAHNLKTAYASRPAFAAIPAATSATQRLLLVDGSLRGLSLISPAFDAGSATIGAPSVSSAQPNGGIFLDPGGFYAASNPPQDDGLPMMAAPTRASNGSIPHGMEQVSTMSASAAIPATSFFTTRLVNAGSGAVTVTLPAANVSKGRRYTIKKIDSSGNAVSVARAGSDTIDGGTSVSLASQYDRATVLSDGTTWHRVG